jgi:hypothetical protein
MATIIELESWESVWACEMTNEELDRWLATEVMGWRESGTPGFEVWAPSGKRFGIFTDSWIPTVNLIQAVQAAEKALADCRISQWFIGRHVGGMPDHGVVKADGSLVENPRDVFESATALCRALYDALRDRP